MSARDPDRGYITWRPTKRISDHGESIFDVLSEDIAAFDEDAGNITFSRIAITREQVALYNLPTNPDHPDVVQAEALPPNVLADIVDTAISRAARSGPDRGEQAAECGNSGGVRNEASLGRLVG
jgi:hypothetical protein